MTWHLYTAMLACMVLTAASGFMGVTAGIVLGLRRGREWKPTAGVADKTPVAHAAPPMSPLAPVEAATTVPPDLMAVPEDVPTTNDGKYTAYPTVVVPRAGRPNLRVYRESPHPYPHEVD